MSTAAEMPSGALRAGHRLIGYVATILRVSLVIALMIMVACIAYQVLMRYVFGKAPSWSEELALLMFSWSTLGGLALGVYEGFHVRLDMLINSLSPSLRHWGEKLIELLTAAFGGFLAWSGLRFVDVTSGSVSAAIGYPIELLHSLAPVSGAFICVFATWRLLAGSPPDAPADVAA